MIGCSMDRANIVKKLQLLLLSRHRPLLKSTVRPTSLAHPILKPSVNPDPDPNVKKAPLSSKRSHCPYRPDPNHQQLLVKARLLLERAAHNYRVPIRLRRGLGRDHELRPRYLLATHTRNRCKMGFSRNPTRPRPSEDEWCADCP